MSEIVQLLDATIVPLIGAAKAASCLLRSAYDAAALHHWLHAPDGQVTTKTTTSSIPDYVTPHDVAAQACIVNHLARDVPGVPVVGEEDGPAERIVPTDYFLVDPCDGTTNFAHGVPYFAVSIARISQGVLRSAVVADPMSGFVYAAIAGQGAALFDPALGVWRRMTASPQSNLRQQILMVEESYGDSVMQQAAVQRLHLLSPHYAGVRKFGSTALDLARLASGVPATLVATRLKSWDFAAGMLLAQEAGAVVQTLEGMPMTLDSTTLLATSPHTIGFLSGLLQPVQGAGKEL